jgi:hypothetical protein
MNVPAAAVQNSATAIFNQQVAVDFSGPAIAGRRLERVAFNYSKVAKVATSQNQPQAESYCPTRQTNRKSRAILTLKRLSRMRRGGTDACKQQGEYEQA